MIFIIIPGKCVIKYFGEPWLNVHMIVKNNKILYTFDSLSSNGGI